MKKAFTLIEILIIITIIAILAGAAFPYVQEYVEESRQAKAKADLDEIAKALTIYESREGEYTKDTLEDLTGRYLDRSPIDPWGIPYFVSTQSKLVYSLGPDRMGYENGEEYAYDNIEVSYEPPLALVSVRWIDKNKSGAVDTQNVPDELHFNFSRRIAPVDNVEIVDETLLPELLSKIYIYRDPDNPDSIESLENLVDGNLNTAPKYLLGDANKDGVIDISDTVTVVNMVLDGKNNNIWGDINQDGVLDMSDVIGIANHITGKKLLPNTYLKDPDFEYKIHITAASHTIVLPLKIDAPLMNGKFFIPGQAKISIKENHGLIKDNSYPYPNYCISNQKVTILAK